MFEDIQEMIIPVALKEATLPDQREFTYWKARLNRTFYLDYYLGDDCEAIELAKVLIQMNMEEKDIPEGELKPIYLWLYTPGGDTCQCDALCDIIESSRIPIVTINMGMAMSSGFLIFLAGKRRYCFEKGSFLIHEGYLNLQGTSAQVDAAHKSYKKELDRMKEYVLKHTKIDSKLFSRNRDKDWYVEGQDIETYGIAKIVHSFDEIV